MNCPLQDLMIEFVSYDELFTDKKDKTFIPYEILQERYQKDANLEVIGLEFLADKIIFVLRWREWAMSLKIKKN